MNLTIQLHPATEPPDADLDVLIFDAAHPEAQFGAFVGDGWVNAQGEAVEGVHHWAHMPAMPVRLPVPYVAARPSDYPECSGDPASCPENEGYGCCKPNPTRLPVPEARELGTVPLPGGGVARLDGPWRMPR